MLKNYGGKKAVKWNFLQGELDFKLFKESSKWRKVQRSYMFRMSASLAVLREKFPSLPVEKRDRSPFSMFHISYGARVKEETKKQWADPTLVDWSYQKIALLLAPECLEHSSYPLLMVTMVLQYPLWILFPHDRWLFFVSSFFPSFPSCLL